jgi:acetyl/propionyl-CoA carboxylase alpha subunit
MLAKLVTRGATREEARRRMNSALIEYRIEGPTTNIPFLRWIINHEDYVANRVHTGWLEPLQAGYKPLGIGQGRRESVAVIAAALYAHRKSAEASRAAGVGDGAGQAGGLVPWVRAGRSRLLGDRA